MKDTFVVGIDEVGRGPIAGPVAVAALQLQGASYKLQVKETEKKLRIKLKDSKKLSEKQRELWFKEIKMWQKEGLCNFKVSMVSAKMIDKIGIVPAIKKCLYSSLFDLRTPISACILLDGGLHAPAQFKNQKTIIKGDEKEPVIALASIVAKVTRDRLMCRLAKKYPNYGLEVHKGYGTKKHYIAVQKYGLSAIHRKTFLKNVRML